MSQPRDQIAPATDLFDCYVPRTGFVLSSAMQGIAVRGQPAAVVAVSPGPDQVARAAALASSALAAAGPNAVITGALPFDGAPVAFLQVAGDVVRSESPLAQFDLHAAERPQVVNTAHEPDEAAYEDAVAEALRSISDGSVDKVVLARTLVIETDQALDPGTIARSLRAADPSAYVFAVGLPGSAHALVGASPELVVRRRGMRVASDPLAGSAPRDVNAAKDRSNGQALLDSVKDRREHRIVADAVA
ncbi:MAG: chorismate-binding protein, partial [Candidatus Dormibacteraeota bacterium]|nr:chorismate-binding protein [Candidatus Dormibacteraeota bacterium]